MYVPPTEKRKQMTESRWKGTALNRSPLSSSQHRPQPSVMCHPLSLHCSLVLPLALWVRGTLNLVGKSQMLSIIGAVAMTSQMPRRLEDWKHWHTCFLGLLRRMGLVAFPQRQWHLILWLQWEMSHFTCVDFLATWNLTPEVLRFL